MLNGFNNNEGSDELESRESDPVNFFLDSDSPIEDDSDQVKALLGISEEPPSPKQVPIRRYVFEDYPGAVHTQTVPVPGMTNSAAYRIEFLSDPAPDGDDSEAILALTGGADGLVSPGGGTDSPSAHLHQQGDEELDAREVVIDKNGQPRHVGSTSPEGEYIKRLKRRAEENLYIFSKGILGRHFLTPHFHRRVCNWLQVCPPYRKMLLMPREHAKTTLVSGSLPCHILIQPARTNIYFPGLAGSECRILLSGETAGMAEKNLRVVQSIFEENQIFRAFWPDVVWEGKAKSESKMWNSWGIIIPRENEWPDPTIRAVGVGGAVTGSRPNVLIKDDLTTFEAANSEVTMDMAIEWHKASRALLDKYEVESGLQSLEFLAATRWAVYDLCSYIIDNDPSVEVSDPSVRRIIDNGKILWPEKYTQADVEQLQREHGSNFYLLYLNTPADPSLVDFDTTLIRDFQIINNKIVFDHDERDLILERRLKLKKERFAAPRPPANIKPGTRLTSEVIERLINAGGAMRMRAT